MLPPFATRFAACTGGIWVSFIEPCLFKLRWNCLYGRFILQIYSDEICEYVFHAFAIWDSQAFPLKIYCDFSRETHCFYVCVCQWWPQTLVAVGRDMGICDVFTAVASREDISRFYLISALTSMPITHPYSNSNSAPSHYLNQMQGYCQLNP